MRLRNIPGSREEIAESPYVVHEDVMREMPGRWTEPFGRKAPLYIEVGMGKGRFLTEMAEKFPDRNFVGIEKYSSVLVRALAKREARPDLTNLVFLRMEAEDLPEVFGEKEVAGIFLNFSDPWPKERHAKRRLMSREFLARYEKILSPGGVVEFKTDNTDLFSFALQEAEAAGWATDLCTWDLHRDAELMAENVMTEYEERFSKRGNPICKMVCHPLKPIVL